jgi:hypothetical protein
VHLDRLVDGPAGALRAVCGSPAAWNRSLYPWASSHTRVKATPSSRTASSDSRSRYKARYVIFWTTRESVASDMPAGRAKAPHWRRAVTIQAREPSHTPRSRSRIGRRRRVRRRHPRRNPRARRHHGTRYRRSLRPRGSVGPAIIPPSISIPNASPTEATSAAPPLLLSGPSRSRCPAHGVPPGCPVPHGTARCGAGARRRSRSRRFSMGQHQSLQRHLGSPRPAAEIWLQRDSNPCLSHDHVFARSSE